MPLFLVPDAICDEVQTASLPMNQWPVEKSDFLLAILRKTYTLTLAPLHAELK